MKRNGTMTCVAAIALAVTGQLMAVPTVGFDLMVTNVNANSATLDVIVNYDADPDGAGLVFLSLDVGGSTDNLTNNGTDFSRFSFAPSTALTGWNPFGVEMDFGPTNSDVAYDTFVAAAALLDGQRNIGTITVNLAGLLEGELVGIGLTLPNLQFIGTDAGQESPPITTQTFELIFGDQVGIVNVDTERFVVARGQSTSDVPEPTTAVLGLIGPAILALRRRKTA